MARSELSKVNDAESHKKKYKLLTKEQKKARIQSIIDKRKLREADKKTAKANIVAAQTLISIKKEPDSNSQRSKRWRENKKITNALLTMRNSRALRLKFDKPNYSEEVRISIVDTPGMGKGVQADADISPASTLCAYGGELIRSCRTVQRRLRDGNDKLLQVGDQLWLDGNSSTTLGPMFNHACDCIANCEFVIDKNKNAYICTKSSEAGNVKKDDPLTIDYGYGTLPKNSLKDNHFKWYLEYCSTHKCM
jgi:hypothetical protein